MKYKHKDYIIDDIQHYSGSEEQINEIIEVYAQAAKADEYEAKARAWNEVMKTFKRQRGAMDAAAVYKVYFSVRDTVRFTESGDEE